MVAYLDDVSVLEALRAAPGEVARIFDHPLEALLDPELVREEGLVPIGSDDWPYEEELHVRFVSRLVSSLFFPLLSPVRSLSLLFFILSFFFLGKSRITASDDNNIKQSFRDYMWLGNIYRLHRFRSAASPVKGLTADILVCPPSPIFPSRPYLFC